MEEALIVYLHFVCGCCRAGGLLFRSNQLAAAAVVGARASNTIATPARGRSSSKRKRAEQEEAQQTDGSSLSLKIWPLIEGFSMGSAAADIELLPCSSEVPLNALQGGTVLDMVCQTGSRSIILLVESSAGGYGSAYSLIKMTFEGEVLYQRQITAAAAQGRPLYIQEATSHILWIACDNGTFVSWDSCYGVALRSVTLPSAHSSTIPRSWLVDYQHSNFDPVAGPVVDAHVLSSSYIITLSAAIHSKPSNINRTIGNKASSKSGSESSSSIYSFSLYSLLTSGDADAVNAAYIGGTLSDCVGKLDPDAAAITASNSLIDDTEDISATKKATAVLKKRLAERQLLDDLGDLSVFAPLTEYEKVSVYSLQLPDDDEMPVRLPVSTLQVSCFLLMCFDVILLLGNTHYICCLCNSLRGCRR